MKKIYDLVPVDVAIWRVGHHHRHVVNMRLESMGLYRGQHRLISRLGYDDGLTHSELAESMRISNATVSKMVQRMEHKGFVERRQDIHDQRISRVYLTELGKETTVKLEEMFLQLQADEIKGFSEEEIAQFMDYLERVNQNLVEYIPHHPKHNKTKEDKE